MKLRFKNHASFWVTAGEKLGKNAFALRALGLASLIISAGYLLWRLAATQVGTSPILFWTLWAAEAFGWLSFALFVKDSWSQPPARPQSAVNGTVAILIPTYNEDIDVLEPTILGSLQVDGASEIWLLDDGNRPWVERLAKDKGVKYLTRPYHSHAKAGNINHALKQVHSDFLLILDADHIPSKQIISELLPYFADESVAVAQSPHAFRNLDSAQHYDRTVNEQSLFFDVLLPGRNDSDSVFWCGSGAILRSSALREVGGIQTRTITEDLETTLAMQRHGWRSVYHSEPLLQGLAPANLSAFLIQRYRWARGTLEVLTTSGSPIFGKNFKLGTRLSFLANLIYYLIPFQHIAFVAVLTTSLITGLLPVTMSLNWFLALWLPQILLSIFVTLAISRGRQLPFSGTKNAWLTASIYIRAVIDRIIGAKSTFQVTPKDGVEEGGLANLRLLWLPLTCAVVLAAATIFRIADYFGFSVGLGPMEKLGAEITVAFAFYQMIILTPVLFNAFFKKQQRHTWRYPVQLDAEVGDWNVQVVDLNLTGLRFIANDLVATHLREGDECDIRISTGGKSSAKARLQIRKIMVRENSPFVECGASVKWADSKSRENAIKVAYLNF